MMPQQSMRSESHIDGRSRLRKMLDGTYHRSTGGSTSLTYTHNIALTSNIEYEKKNIVSAMRYCWSVKCKSVVI